MIEPISISISLAALTISTLTAWLTLFRRGSVRMTQPALIFFGSDGHSYYEEVPSVAKVYLRTLLYATSKRGRIIEAMFVRLHRSETSQTFNVWVYGEDVLARGSGLFVGENGLVCNHHFLLPDDGTTFHFLPGDYTLEVFALLVGDASTVKLISTTLSISQKHADELKQPGAGIYFDWRPESRSYHPHVRSTPGSPTLQTR